MKSTGERCALSFSGGKDSVLALDRAIRQGLAVDFLVTMYDEDSQRVRFHGEIGRAHV